MFYFRFRSAKIFFSFYIFLSVSVFCGITSKFHIMLIPFLMIPIFLELAHPYPFPFGEHLLIPPFLFLFLFCVEKRSSLYPRRGRNAGY